MFLNVVCVNWHNYDGQGVRYVNILNNMVRRNLPPGTEGRFVCYSDTLEGDYDTGVEVRLLPEGLDGWWNKLALFAPNVFPDGERVMFLDLDTCVVGGLDRLIEYDGDFAILSDIYHPTVYNSSIMLWKAGVPAHIWETYDKMGRPQFAGGDQAAIWRLHKNADILQEKFPGYFVSYKAHAQFSIPHGARIVYFHGRPKPAEITEHSWVPKVWQKDGVSLFDNKVVGNTEDNTLVRNMKDAIDKGYQFIPPPKEAHSDHAVIVGGGMSAGQLLPEIADRKKHGQTIVALNGSYKWLRENGIEPDMHVILDARPENIAFVPELIDAPNLFCLYSAQCDPQVLEKAGRRLLTWLPYADGLLEILDNYEGAYIGGGSTVGLKAIPLLWVNGYREFHLYGYDSCYYDDTHHAYPQPLNDNENTIIVEVSGTRFKVAPWMATQAMEYREMVFDLINNKGCTITTHGTGLIPFVTSKLAETFDPEEITKIGDFWWPAKDYVGHNCILAESMDIAVILEHCERREIVVQAGGNVGVWPKELLKHFKQVYTFEPDQTNYKCLNLNIPPQHGFIKINAALGEKETTSGMERTDDNCGAHFLSGDGDIRVITLDSLELAGCDLLQLDIEGYELAALRGARETITKYKPTIVTEEKGLGSRIGESDTAIADFLAELGYCITGKVSNDVIYVPKPANGDK